MVEMPQDAIATLYDPIACRHRPRIDTQDLHEVSLAASAQALFAPLGADKRSWQVIAALLSVIKC